MTKQCADCRDGEHDNYDDEVRRTFVRDVDTGELIRRAWMCEAHREMYLEDGYDVQVLFAGQFRSA